MSGLVTKNAPEMTSKRLRSQHFLSFSQFYSISDRSVDVAPSRISTLHPIVGIKFFHIKQNKSYCLCVMHNYCRITDKYNIDELNSMINTSTSNPFLCAADFFLQLGICKEAVR